MKQKISISIDENKIKIIEEYIKKGIFRNKSHALEKGIEIVINSLENKNNKLGEIK